MVALRAMTTSYLLAILAAIFGTSSVVNACSCVGHDDQSEEQQIERAFTDADGVFVAKVVSVKHSLLPEDPEGRYLIEEASFVISEVMKGSHKLWEVVRVRSELGGGTCGRRARNDPPWLEEANETEPRIFTASVVSDEWLIYASGVQPYELSLCDRSFPTNLRSGSDAEYLRATQLHSGKKHGI